MRFLSTDMLNTVLDVAYIGVTVALIGVLAVLLIKRIKEYRKED